jgi:hypothetical protein
MTKKKDPAEYAVMGRPTVMTDVVIAKLEQAFSFGCSDREACLYACIDPKTLYRYLNENPEFRQRRDLLKETPVLLARQSVINGFKKDHWVAWEYLKSRKPDEFRDVPDVQITYATWITKVLESESNYEQGEATSGNLPKQSDRLGAGGTWSERFTDASKSVVVETGGGTGERAEQPKDAG